MDEAEKPILIEEMEYDAAGNLKLFKSSHLADGTIISTRKVSFTYSAKNELISEIRGDKKAITSQYYNEICRYDSCSNRIYSEAQGVDDYYEYDTLGQLVRDRENLYTYDFHYNRTAKNGNIFLPNEYDELSDLFYYDQRGNLYKNQTYRYDALNRLIEADGIKFEYDPFDRKFIRDISEKQTVLFDGENEFAVYDQDGFLQQLKIPGLKTCKNRNIASAIELEGRAYSPLYDCAGNIVHLIDTKSRQISHTYRYSPFGELIYLKEFTYNPWRFAGKRFEPKINLIDFGRRYYDPLLGRWLSPDPADFSDSINLYQYCFNNPFKFYDPDGEFVFLVAIPIAEIILGAAVVESIITAVAVSATTYLLYEGMSYADKYINQQRRRLPLTGKPNSSDSVDWGNGKGTIRDYDADGKAKTDYDFGHDHNGSGDPHAHDWNWSDTNDNASPYRPGARPIKQGE